MSTEIKLEIEYPEGYELAESKPREVNFGDAYINICGKIEYWGFQDKSVYKHIILKKKAPEYYVTDLMAFRTGKKMVEIRALEDALALFDKDIEQWTSGDVNKFNKINELIL